MSAPPLAERRSCREQYQYVGMLSTAHQKVAEFSVTVRVSTIHEFQFQVRVKSFPAHNNAWQQGPGLVWACEPTDTRSFMQSNASKRPSPIIVPATFVIIVDQCFVYETTTLPHTYVCYLLDMNNLKI